MSILYDLLYAALDPALRREHTENTPAAELCSRCCAEDRVLRLARRWQALRDQDDPPAA